MTPTWLKYSVAALLMPLSGLLSSVAAREGADSSGGAPPQPLGGPAVVAFNIPNDEMPMADFQQALRHCYTEQYDYKTIRQSELEFRARIATMYKLDWRVPVEQLQFEFRALKLGVGTPYPFPEEALGPASHVLLPKGTFKRGDQEYSFVTRIMIGTYGSGFCGEYPESRPKRCEYTDGGDVLGQLALADELNGTNGVTMTPTPAYRSYNPETGLVDQPLLLLDYGAAMSLEKNNGVTKADGSYVTCLQRELSRMTGAKNQPRPLDLIWRKYKRQLGR